jgi:translation initiation factor 1
MGDGVVRIQRDSKSRKGKTVTLITGVALNDEALHTLASELKRLCGSGGAVKDGVIEIQGDHRETLLEVFKKRGYKVKLAGG